MVTDDSGLARLDLPRPDGLELWSPGAPALYDVSISSGTDVARDRVGFRTIETEGRDILLNGELVDPELFRHRVTLSRRRVRPCRC